ncbi:MAG TPA: hypothetical protein VGB30_07300 [bacterium]|jgi:hypothetical protein
MKRLLAWILGMILLGGLVASCAPSTYDGGDNPNRPPDQQVLEPDESGTTGGGDTTGTTEESTPTEEGG